MSDADVVAAAQEYVERNPVIDLNGAAMAAYIASLPYSDQQKELFLEYLRQYSSSSMTDPKNPGTTIEVN